MQALLALLCNGLLGLTLAFRLPLRLLRRAPPAYVRFVLRADPPYRAGFRRGWWRRRPARGVVVALEDFRRALERLAKDGRVRGVVLETSALAIAPAKRMLLAGWLAAFRGSGKEVVGFAIAPGSAEYALLCSANRIVLPRPGRLGLDGLVLEATAIGGAMERLGVRAEFVRRGEYKTAPEFFTRSDVSPNQQALVERLLDDRHQELVDVVATGRRLAPADAAARVDQGPYSATRAVAAGLVDALADEVELPGLLEMAPPPGDDVGVPGYGAYLRALRVPVVRWVPFRRSPRLAVVPLNGMLTDGDGGPGRPWPSAAGAEPLLAGLRAAARDARCPAVLLYVNSPGGSALASERVADELLRVAEKKPVVAYTDRVSASGGYLASLGAKELWAGPHSVVGSIGVFAGKFDAQALLQRLGIHRTAYTRGEHAGLLTASRGLTPAERAALELDVEETYRRFVERVARSRKLTVEEVLGRAEGRVFTAGEALAQGLLDRLGTFEDAAARAMEMAGVPRAGFDISVHGLPRARLGLASLLPRSAQVFALWWPWLSGDGLSGSEAFGAEL